MSIDFNALVLGPTFDAFAEPVTFIPAAGGTITSLYGPNQGRGIFDDGHRIVDLGGDAPTSMGMPVLGVRLSEFVTAPKQNDRVTVPSVGLTYIVKDDEPDGHGHSLLRLEVAA